MSVSAQGGTCGVILVPESLTMRNISKCTRGLLFVEVRKMQVAMHGKCVVPSSPRKRRESSHPGSRLYLSLARAAARVYYLASRK